MKKRNICLVFLVCLFIFILFMSSCTKKDNIIDNIDINNNENLEIQDMIDFKGEYLEVYKNKKVPEVRKFLGTAIVNVRPEEYRDFDIPIISEEDIDARLILNLVHLESYWLEDYAISASQSNTRAYTVYIVKPKEEYVEQVVSAVEYRLSDLNRTLINYPDQLYLVDNAVIEQVGDYLVVVICDNEKEVFNEIYKVMDTVDLNKLTTVALMTEEERVNIENKALQEEIDALYATIDEVVITPIEEEKEILESIKIVE